MKAFTHQIDTDYATVYGPGGYAGVIHREGGQWRALNLRHGIDVLHGSRAEAMAALGGAGTDRMVTISSGIQDRIAEAFGRARKILAE